MLIFTYPTAKKKKGGGDGKKKIKTILRERLKPKNKFVPMSLTRLAVSKLITAGTGWQSGLALPGALAERLFDNSLPAVMVSAAGASPLKETAPVHGEMTAPHLRYPNPPGLSPCRFLESGL